MVNKSSDSNAYSTFSANEYSGNQ